MPASKKDQQESSRYDGEAWTKIVSASVGSAITALTVTPLEVVKVRQQAAGFIPVGTRPLQPPATASLPPIAFTSPRTCGCGTFVLCTGLGEYLTSRDKAGYFDPKTGALKQEKSVAEVLKTGGPIRIIRSIFVHEGLAGIYAGLAPTLVMGIPNTVLYFYTYEELAPRLKGYFPSDHPVGGAVPAIAGASARFVASLSTAPLELLRTRQAAQSGLGGAGEGNNAVGRGMISEFREMVSKEGALSLFRGVWPTIMRDVPFSAIYWLSIESMRDRWRAHRHYSKSPYTVSTTERTIEALVNGSVSGVIAAAFTTPLDVLKTRSQVVSPTVPAALATSHGAVSASSVNSGETSTIQLAKSIVEREGISGLWRGNVARCMKVAPACGIMIATYEAGKRLLAQELH